MDTTRYRETSRSLGFGVRGGTMGKGAVVSRIPGRLTDAEMSICGIKGFMIDEEREFKTEDGRRVTVTCASIAALEITDSPVHVHGETTETYTILEGEGRMVLDERVVDVSPGSVILLPPGVEHGLTANDPEIPVKVLMTFQPGLAPKTEAEFRDERIVHASSRAHIAALGS